MVAYTDCDQPADLALLPEALRLLDDDPGLDLVIGYRLHRREGPRRWLYTRVYITPWCGRCSACSRARRQLRLQCRRGPGRGLAVSLPGGLADLRLARPGVAGRRPVGAPRQRRARPSSTGQVVPERGRAPRAGALREVPVEHPAAPARPLTSITSTRWARRSRRWPRSGACAAGGVRAATRPARTASERWLPAADAPFERTVRALRACRGRFVLQRTCRPTWRTVRSWGMSFSRLSLTCLLVALQALFARAETAPAWTPLGGPTGGDVRSLAADPRDPRRVFLGTSDGVLYRSDDGGRRWRRVLPGFPQRGMSLDDLVFDARGPPVGRLLGGLGQRRRRGPQRRRRRSFAFFEGSLERVRCVAWRWRRRTRTWSWPARRWACSAPTTTAPPGAASAPRATSISRTWARWPSTRRTTRWSTPAPGTCPGRAATRGAAGARPTPA